MAALEPIVPIGGEQLIPMLGILFFAVLAWRLLHTYALMFLELVSSWASMTVLVFLRTGIGSRALSAKALLCAIAFLYVVGNMVGHNYHDFYRNRAATILGARFHFTYLVLFLVMAVYRKFEAWRLRNSIDTDAFGTPSRLGRLWNGFLNRITGGASDTGVYRQLLAEPLLVISVGLFLALVPQIWLGWYLVLTGCLLCYWSVVLRYG